MRKMVLLAAMLALTALTMAVTPAMADSRLENRLERLDDDFFFVVDRDRDRFDRFDFDGDVEQEFEQESESGDIDQSFEVSGGGDNANQCVNVSGTANTGNLQGGSGFVQFDSDIDDFDQDDVGNDLTVEGDSTVTCNQQVNQAAAAG